MELQIKQPDSTWSKVIDFPAAGIASVQKLGSEMLAMASKVESPKIENMPELRILDGLTVMATCKVEISDTYGWQLVYANWFNYAENGAYLSVGVLTFNQRQSYPVNYPGLTAGA